MSTNLYCVVNTELIEIGMQSGACGLGVESPRAFQVTGRMCETFVKRERGEALRVEAPVEKHRGGE